MWKFWSPQNIDGKLHRVRLFNLNRNLIAPTTVFIWLLAPFAVSNVGQTLNIFSISWNAHRSIWNSFDATADND